MSHGTRSCYVSGCRLPACKAANAAYMRRRRARPRVGAFGASRAASGASELYRIGTWSRTELLAARGAHP